MAKPLLTLETYVPERSTIVIDGISYDLADPSEFSIADQVRLERIARKRQQLIDSGANMSDDSALEAVSEDLVTFVRAIVKAPPDVLARLTDSMRTAIIVAFTSEVEKKGQTRPQTEADRREQNRNRRRSRK